MGKQVEKEKVKTRGQRKEGKYMQWKTGEGSLAKYSEREREGRSGKIRREEVTVRVKDGWRK